MLRAIFLCFQSSIFAVVAVATPSTQVSAVSCKTLFLSESSTQQIPLAESLSTSSIQSKSQIRIQSKGLKTDY
jgi:hypothetical protein